MTVYRIPPLPGSSVFRYTRNVKEWKAEWDKLIKPLEEMGFAIHSFDPGINLMNPKNTMSPMAHLTIWAAYLILHQHHELKTTEEGPEAERGATRADGQLGKAEEATRDSARARRESQGFVGARFAADEGPSQEAGAPDQRPEQGRLSASRARAKRANQGSADGSSGTF